MTIQDIKTFCKTSGTPLTAVKCNPSYNEKKGRVTKGELKTYAGWKDKIKYDATKTNKTPFESTNATMLLINLKPLKLYCFDIDVCNGKNYKEVLKPDILKILSESSEYIVETGSKGAHFYFKLDDDFIGDVKNYINIGSDMLNDEEKNNASVDVIMESVITEGSMYTFESVNYNYTLIKGASLSDCDINSGFQGFYDNYLKKEVVNEKVYNNTFDVEEIIKHLDNIPNSERNWDTWYKMAQTVFNILGTEGIDIFTTWSSKNPIHSDIELYKLWKSLKFQSNNQRGIGTLLFLSKESNQTTYKNIRSQYALAEYNALKEMMETNHFFIEEPKPLYVRHNGIKLIYYKPAEMNDLLKGMKFPGIKNNKPADIEFYSKWSEDESKKRFKRIGYYPNPKECPSDEFNGFFPCRASTLPVNYEKIDIQPILNHFNILCNHHKVSVDFLIMSFAQIVQQPWYVPGMLQLVYGIEGSGKDILITWFGNLLLGPHQYAFIGSTDNLFKPFNAELTNKVLIHCDEIHKISPKNMEDLKRMVTASTARCEKKGVDVELLKWIARLYFTTNYKDAIYTSMNDRRICANTSSNEKCKDSKYFVDLYKVLSDDKVVRAFYDYLMKLDISTYNHINRPITPLMKEMKKFSLDKILFWIQNEESGDNIIEGSAKDLLLQYNNWADSCREKKHTLTSFGRDMTGLTERNIGITKTKNSCMIYSISKNTVLDYLASEDLV